MVTKAAVWITSELRSLYHANLKINILHNGLELLTGPSDYASFSIPVGFI